MGVGGGRVSMLWCGDAAGLGRGRTVGVCSFASLGLGLAVDAGGGVCVGQWASTLLLGALGWCCAWYRMLLWRRLGSWAGGLVTDMGDRACPCTVVVWCGGGGACRYVRGLEWLSVFAAFGAGVGACGCHCGCGWCNGCSGVAGWLL